MQIQTWPGGRLAGLRATLPALTQVPSDHYTYCGVNHDEPFELRNTLAELGNYPRSHKVCLAPQLGGSKQLALFEEGKLPSEVVRQHYDRSLPPAVYIYGLQGHELGGAGFLHSGGRVFLAPDVIPAYFNQRLRHDGHSLDEYQRGGLFRDDVSTIDLDGPVASVLHPNLVYGHFLLEILPKLHLLSRLRAAGMVFPVALPEQIAPWVKAIVGLYFSPEEILLYDVRNTRIRSPCFVLPSMMHVNYQFHPDFNLAIEEMKGHVLQHVRPGHKKRIWISRSRFSGRSTLKNAEDVESTMIALGFEVVHPQDLTFPEQVALFDGADCVAGEYGSAIHNTLFSRRGARVFCINRINWYQSGVASLRSQSLAYLPPADGRFRDWRCQHTPDAAFHVDCTRLEEAVKHFFE